MDFSDILFHLLGFAAPALALGLLLPLASRFLFSPARIVTGFWAQATIVSACGLAVLVGGLWFFGQDGKMATYGALVGVTCSVQWTLAGAWRR
jgi:hypothetical protein